MWRHLRRGTLAALLLAFAGHCAWAIERADENEIKAAVIYNLLLFVQWPESVAAPGAFRFCVQDEGALTTALRAFERKKLHGRALEIHRINRGYEELDACSAVMVEAGSPGVLTRLVVAARNRPLLVIAEGTGVVERGAMIGLHTDGGRVTFDINLGAMKRSGLAPSSKILRLARTLIE